MQLYKLFMLVIGCKPPGRFTEQHDVYLGIGTCMKDLVPSIIAFWPEANGRLHIDSWREIGQVDGYLVEIKERSAQQELRNEKEVKLFFINLGGYKPGDAEEYHYKLLVAAPDKVVASQKAKQTAFYKHTGFDGAVSHIDDRYGIDVDDMYEIADILEPPYKEKFEIILTPARALKEDTVHPGYITLEKLANADQ